LPAGHVFRGGAGQEALHDADHARVDRKDEAGSRRLQRLGDGPGEALVVAHAGHQCHLAAQVDGDHARLWISRAVAEFAGIGTRLANRRRPGKMNRLARLALAPGARYNRSFLRSPSARSMRLIMPDLSVTVDGLRLPNPFVIASGPPGTNA